MKDTHISDNEKEKLSHTEKKGQNNQEALIKESHPLLKHASLMENSPLFEKKSMKKGEILFDEGSIDSHLYIIQKGSLSVEKYTTIEKTQTKQLAILTSGDFLGENGLSATSKPKEAKIVCLENTDLLQIDLKSDMKKFLEEYPSIGFEILKHIIIETNQRLSEINRLFTSNYELEKTINSLKNVDLKAIFMILEKIQSILDIDYILYFEKHMILDQFLTLRYDSRFPNKMQEKIFEKTGLFMNLDVLYQEVNISPDDKIILNKLSLGEEIYGYIILGREKRSFDGSDKKILSGASNSLAGIVKKYLGDKEEKNKLYISEMKK